MSIKLKKTYKEQIDAIKSHIETKELVAEITKRFSNFTLHDLNHFGAVENNASKIIKYLNLSDEEKFCLVAACYCHDLGMAFTKYEIGMKEMSINEIRKWHGKLSNEYINNELSTIIFEERHREAIGIISEGHGRWDWDNDYFDDTNAVNEGNIRIRLLTVILSLADLLDRRAARRNPKAFLAAKRDFGDTKEGKISMIHWLRHYYSMPPVIINRNNQISITLKCRYKEDYIGGPYHYRAPLVQELIQGDVLKVINNKMFKKICIDYGLQINLTEANNKPWKCNVKISGGDMELFPEEYVENVLSENFIYQRSIELDKNEYKEYRIKPFHSENDLELSYVQKPFGISPKGIGRIKEKIKNGNFIDNWDIVLWNIDDYIESIQSENSNEITKRISAMLYMLGLIKDGIIKRLYINASDLTLESTTSTKYISKVGHKRPGEGVSTGGRIDILTSSSKNKYWLFWENVKDKLGLPSKIEPEKYKRYLEPLIAYNYGIITFYSVSKSLTQLTNIEYDSQIESELNKLKPYFNYINKLDKLKIKGDDYVFSEFKTSDRDDLKILDYLSSSYPWIFKNETIEKLKSKNARNFILRHKTSNIIIGYIFSQENNENTCHIEKMLVHPFFRGRGLGKKLIETLIENNNNITKYSLNVRESNIPAIRLYENIGFCKVGATKLNYYKKTGETKEDKTAIYMEFLNSNKY